MSNDEFAGVRKGDLVRFRKMGRQLHESGVVACLWTCVGEAAIAVRTDDGGSVGIVPSLGDEISVVIAA